MTIGQTTLLQRLRNPLIWICLAAGIVIFAGLGKAPLEPFDDACYADVARNIVEKGNWLDFYWLGGQPFLEKPPVYYWFTAACFKIIGVNEFGARLLPALCAVGTLVLAFLFSQRHGSMAAGVFSVLLLMATPQFWEFSSRAMLDIPVTFFIALSLFFFSLSLQQPRMIWYLLYGTAFSIAIMTKSVVGLFPVLVTAVFFAVTDPKRLLSAKYWAGTGFGLGLASIWHVFAFLRYGDIFIREYFGYHVIQRITGEIVIHREPFFYFLNYLFDRERFLLLMFAVALPFFLFETIRSRSRVRILLLVWILLVFLGISLSRSKLPWYVIPLYPPMAIAVSLSCNSLCKSRNAFSWAYKTAIVLALAWSVHAIYRFRVERADHALISYMPAQMRMLLLDLKQNTTPRDTVFIYGVGNAVHLTNFYAERKICYLFDDAGTLSAQQRIPSNYIGKGVIRQIRGTDALAGVLAEHTGVLLVEKELYGKIRASLSCATVAESKDLIAIRGI